MVEYTDEQKEEIRQMLAAAQNRQAFFEQAKVWFTDSLYNSEYLKKNGERLPEIHDAGVAIYQQFMHDWTGPKTPAAPEKKDDEKTGDEP
jgi:hypothetical protein